MTVQQVTNSKFDKSVEHDESGSDKSIDESMTDAFNEIQSSHQQQLITRSFSRGLESPLRSQSHSLERQSLKTVLRPAESVKVEHKAITSQLPERPVVRASVKDQVEGTHSKVTFSKNNKEVTEQKNISVDDAMPRQSTVLIKDNNYDAKFTSPVLKPNSAPEVGSLMTQLFTSQTRPESTFQTKNLHYVFNQGDGKHSVDIQTNGLGDNRTILVQPSNAYLGQHLRMEMASQPVMGNVIFRDSRDDSQSNKQQFQQEDEEADA